MTTVESLPIYAQAEAVAQRKGDNLLNMINAYLTGYVAGASKPVEDKKYPSFRLDLSKFDVVTPKVDETTGYTVWPKGFIDD